MSLGKVIFHIDVNSAFLSWEAVYRLHHLGWKGDLREQVSAVGGDMPMRHGIILANSQMCIRDSIEYSEIQMYHRDRFLHILIVLLFLLLNSYYCPPK